MLAELNYEGYKEGMNEEFPRHIEPDEIFLPLSKRKYTEFYSTEMDDFDSDIEFYKKHCGKGSRILELGCGTGRISTALATTGCLTTGLDLSMAMLQQASKQTNSSLSYLCMDMTQMAFTCSFDNILIPYNTLNLLKEAQLIKHCLKQSCHFLKDKGTLLLQLHIPDKELIQLKGEKRFQFQMFPLTHGHGKLIKETLRWYSSDTETIHLEERYRVRPIDNNAPREDFCHTLHLAGFSVKQWLHILQECGFQKLTLFGDYNSRFFQIKKDSKLLIKASRT